MLETIYIYLFIYLTMSHYDCLRYGCLRHIVSNFRCYTTELHVTYSYVTECHATSFQATHATGSYFRKFRVA